VADLDIATRSRIAAEKLAAQDLKYKQLQLQLDEFRGKMDVGLPRGTPDVQTLANFHVYAGDHGQFLRRSRHEGCGRGTVT